MANDRMDTRNFRLTTAAIVTYCVGMLALFLYLNHNEHQQHQQPALRGEHQHQSHAMEPHTASNGDPVLSEAEEEANPITYTLDKLCGASVDSGYFAEILLDAQAFSGTAYMIFVAVLLSQKIRALGAWAIKKAISKLPAKTDPEESATAEGEIKAHLTNQAIEKVEEGAENAVDNAMDAVTDKFGEEASDAVASREEPDHNQRDHGVNIWFAYGQLFLLCFALYSYLSEIPSASQASWECRSALFVSAPFAKTVSLPMWIVLMDVAQYAYWLLHRQMTPKQQTGIPAPTPPLDSNYLTFILMAVCTALVLVWFVTALPEFLLLVAFLPTTIFYFVIQPVGIMVLLPQFVDWSWEMLGGMIPSLKDVKSEGVSGSFTIKIAAAQGFCSAADSIKYLHVYGQTGSYSTIVGDSIYTAVYALPRCIQSLANLSLPSFSFPMELPTVELELFKMSVFLALLSYGLVPFLAYYHRHLKDWGSETMFATQEVVLEVGEQSDDLSNDDPLKEREFTGRKRLARYWNMFAHAGETKVAVHDLITERLLLKRRQAFKELNKDGDGYLTKEELEGYRNWLEELDGDVLGRQGIGKEDIDELLDEKVDLDHDGKISFDEFVQVRAGDLQFMAGEAVRIRGSDGRYTTAEVVRREEPAIVHVGDEAHAKNHVDYYIVRTFAFRVWQPSWLLAKLLVDGMMLPALVLSAAQQLVVVLKNSVRRGYHDNGRADEGYHGSMVFMGKEEKARHVRIKTKYLWLWQYVPYATPEQKQPYFRDYGYVTTSTVARFAQDNPGVKILDLNSCRNVGTDGIAAVGTSCSALKNFLVMRCGLEGTVCVVLLAYL
jgi:hypothetical protein